MASPPTRTLTPTLGKTPLAVFAYGFRPFFLLAPSYGLIAILAWIGVYFGIFVLPLAWPATLWHAHEMIFGFAMAGMAGFMLTAVPNWTQAAPVRDGKLAALVLLWAAGRAALWAADLLPAGLVALLDLAFIPALGLAVARPLLRQVATSGPRNLVFLGLLGLLWTGDLLTHLDALERTTGFAWAGLQLGVDVLLLAITLVGGRIIPTFTASALRPEGGRSPRSVPLIDRVAMLSMAALLVSDLAFGAGDPVGGAIALVAAIANGARLILWRPLATLGSPILWVLHLGYGWLVLGLGLSAVSGLSRGEIVPPTAALHALTAGAITTMLVAVMSRAALGHTGRALVTPPWGVAAYLLVTLAAALRVLAPFAGTWDVRVLAASGVFWAAAMVSFLLVFVPMLVSPRADGRAG